MAVDRDTRQLVETMVIAPTRLTRPAHSARRQCGPTAAGGLTARILTLNASKAFLTTATLLLTLARLSVLGEAHAAVSDSSCSSQWVGSWITSPSDASALQPTLANQTLRMIIAPHLVGQTLRIRFSNRFGSAPVTLDHIEVGLRAGASAALVAGSSRAVSFAGAVPVTISPAEEVVSDPVSLSVDAFQELAISVYIAGVITSPSEHFTTRQTSYLTPSGTGDHASDDDASAFSQTTGGPYSVGWYFLDGVDVRTPGTVAAVVTFGDSITDGFEGLPDSLLENHEGIDANGRYPDFLARRLIAAGRPLSVLNAGISGNRILADGLLPMFGPSGLSRLQRDVVDQPGVTDVIVLEGINDIGQTPADADQVITGLGEIVDELHASGLRVLLGTLTPAGGNSLPTYGSAQANSIREQVNAWIRTSSTADAVVDFDAAIRDPQDPSRINPPYDSGDHLHPSLAGYEAMAGAVDLTQLEGNDRVGDACDLQPGKKLVVRDRDGDASRREVRVVSKHDSGIGAAPPGSGADPTLGGGELVLLNPITSESDTFVLPATHWKGLGHMPGTKGYKYTDPDQVDGPCKKVLFKPGKVLKALCRGSQITFSLDEPQQKSLAVKFTTGSAGALASCLEFGGTRVIKDTPAANGKRGVFKAKGAAAPAQCPVP